MRGPAVVAAVQIDAEAEATSFADQPVTFIDADDQRRSLDPTDLGLGQDQWVAADGSGLGALSPSGEMWAMVTREKVVTLELATGRVQTAELPDGGLPTAPQWFGPDQLVVGSNDRPRKSYLVDVNTMALTVLDVPRFRVQVLDDGSILTFERIRGRAVIRMRSPDGTLGELAIPFDWDNPLPGVSFGSDVAVFVDSLVETGSATGSRVEVFGIDGDSNPPRTLAWPRRRTADDLIGWIDARSLLVRRADNLCVWQPATVRLSCTGGFETEVALSVAVEAVSFVA